MSIENFVNSVRTYFLGDPKRKPIVENKPSKVSSKDLSKSTISPCDKTSIEIKPNDFEIGEYGSYPLLFKIRYDAQCLNHTLNFLENIHDLGCLAALSTTCKFFNDTLKTRLEPFKPIHELYKPLSGEIFKNWQEIARLPKLEKSFTSLSNKEINNIPKSLMRGSYRNRPCIIFKTLIRNSDGTFNSYDLEVLVYVTSPHGNYWEYPTGQLGLRPPNDSISNHLKSLVKHKPAGRITSETTFIDAMDLMDGEGEQIRYFESSDRTTTDGKSIVELVAEEI